jgi:hypothetical protein
MMKPPIICDLIYTNKKENNQERIKRLLLGDICLNSSILNVSFVSVLFLHLLKCQLFFKLFCC